MDKEDKENHGESPKESDLHASGEDHGPEKEEELIESGSNVVKDVGQELPSMTPVDEVSNARISELAIASLILGILALPTCGISGIIGLIMGIVALVQVRRHRESLKGHGIAIAGIAASGFFTLVISFIIIYMMVPAYNRYANDSYYTSCLVNTRSITTAIMMYQMDYNDYNPSAVNWSEAISPYLRSSDVFHCPATDTKEQCYAMNKVFCGKKIDYTYDLSSVILIFESKAGHNQSGGPELLPSTPRHFESIKRPGTDEEESVGVYNVGFADGHVRPLTRTKIMNPKLWNLSPADNK